MLVACAQEMNAVFADYPEFCDESGESHTWDKIIAKSPLHSRVGAVFRVVRVVCIWRSHYDNCVMRRVSLSNFKKTVRASEWPAPSHLA